MFPNTSNLFPLLLEQRTSSPLSSMVVDQKHPACRLLHLQPICTLLTYTMKIVPNLFLSYQTRLLLDLGLWTLPQHLTQYLYMCAHMQDFTHGVHSVNQLLYCAIYLPFCCFQVLFCLANSLKHVTLNHLIF